MHACIPPSAAAACTRDTTELAQLLAANTQDSLAFLSTLRNTYLHIDQATHKEAFTEAQQFKQSGGLMAAR